MMKLSLNKLVNIDSLPVTFDKQILTSGEALQSICEIDGERRGVRAARALIDDGLDDRKQVPTAMVVL